MIDFKMSLNLLLGQAKPRVKNIQLHDVDECCAVCGCTNLKGLFTSEHRKSRAKVYWELYPIS
jgi:hypothetical protein